jgi:hypothetical protein
LAFYSTKEKANGQSSSQASNQPLSARRETIPMSHVVIEPVPKEGRLKCFLLGNTNRAEDGGGEY